MFFPSIVIFPLLASLNLAIRDSVVLFPQPVLPTIAVIEFGLIVNDIPSRIFFLVSYANSTFSNLIVPLIFFISFLPKDSTGNLFSS